jgi:hypothetical protein
VLDGHGLVLLCGFVQGYPPLPARKFSRISNLQDIIACKVFQAKGLPPNICRHRTYGRTSPFLSHLMGDFPLFLL